MRVTVCRLRGALLSDWRYCSSVFNLHSVDDDIYGLTGSRITSENGLSLVCEYYITRFALTLPVKGERVAYAQDNRHAMINEIIDHNCDKSR